MATHLCSLSKYERQTQIIQWRTQYDMYFCKKKNNFSQNQIKTKKKSDLSFYFEDFFDKTQKLTGLFVCQMLSYLQTLGREPSSSVNKKFINKKPTCFNKYKSFMWEKMS